MRARQRDVAPERDGAERLQEEPLAARDVGALVRSGALRGAVATSVSTQPGEPRTPTTSK
jgi:hypothetical protein